MLLSTNPIAVAMPAVEEPPVVLDMATTVAAYGKVKTKAQRGETMPEGWMIDREGRPLTDPKRAEEGFLLPIGGYKGYGLALIVRPARRHAERRRDGQGRDRLQPRRRRRRPTPGRRSWRSTRPRSAIADDFSRRVDALVRDLRASRAHARRGPHLAAGRAEPRQAHRIRSATACRSRRDCAQSLDKVAVGPRHREARGLTRSTPEEGIMQLVRRVARRAARRRTAVARGGAGRIRPSPSA